MALLGSTQLIKVRDPIGEQRTRYLEDEGLPTGRDSRFGDRGHQRKS